MRVLVTADHYLPGYLAGGPIRTLSAMVDALGDQIEFWIATRDRDLGSMVPYPNATQREWHHVSRARVRYLAPHELGVRTIQRLCKDIAPDAVYLNSFFSPSFTIAVLALRRLNGVPKARVILAPRGELAAGALALRTRKKRLYIALARAGGLCDGITWHASSELEREDIRRFFGSRAHVHVAPNLAAPEHLVTLQREPKQPGSLRIALLARLARNKNVVFALDVLRELRGNVVFDIWGPAQDHDYHQECERAAAALPSNITVHFHGPLIPDRIPDMLAAHDVFLLPTHGENFGHAILEALRAGCPVVVSDRTPWRHLEQSGVGWDLPLSHPERFTAALQRCVDMTATEHRGLSERAVHYAMSRAADARILDVNRAMFLADR